MAKRLYDVGIPITARGFRRSPLLRLDTRCEMSGFFRSDFATAVDDPETLLTFAFSLRLLKLLAAHNLALASAHVAPRRLADAALMHLRGLAYPRRPLIITM